MDDILAHPPTPVNHRPNAQVTLEALSCLQLLRRPFPARGFLGLEAFSARLLMRARSLPLAEQDN